MRLDEQLDDALRRLPMWAPPAHFVRRVASLARTEVQWSRSDVGVTVWVRHVLHGTAAAGLAWAAGLGIWWMLGPYLRLMTVAANVMITEPLAVSWTCAALSLATAFYTCRSLFSRI